MDTIARIIAWHRAPSGTALPWLNPMASLPPDVRLVLRAAAGEAASVKGTTATDASADERRAAAMRFIREVLLAPNASYYRNLGVERDAPIERIRDHYRELISIFHPDRLYAKASPGDAALAPRLNEAYNALKHPESRARYDRTHGAAAEPAPPSGKRATAASSNDSRATPRRALRYPTWHMERGPSALRRWYETCSASALKAMTLGAILLVVVAAVLLVGGHESTTLAVAPNVERVSSKQARDLASASDGREGALTALVEHSAPADVPSAAKAAVRPAHTGAATPTKTPDPVVSVALAAPVRIAAAEPAPARVASPVPSSPVATAAAPSSLPRIGVPASPPVVAVHAPPVVVAVMLPQAPSPPATSSAASAGPIAESTATPRAAVLPSAAEVDSVVARFVQAYETGDLAALLALVDPEVAQDDRIAFTIANFSRVFRETSSRRIELEVLQRTFEEGQARIRLAARTTVNEKSSSTRAGAGELTLVVKKRGGVPTITDVRYREHGPAA